MTIRPTHTCFDDALEMLERALKANPGSFESDELKLVHAICVAPDGHEYAHAWVESDGLLCWFQGLVDGQRAEFAADMKGYYEELNVKETIKYTPQEACDLNYRHNTFGPWETRFLDLCRKPGEPHLVFSPSEKHN